MISNCSCKSALVVVLLATPFAWSEDPGLQMIDISPSVVMAKNPNGSNLTAIALDDGLVFVDAGLSTEEAAGFRRAMEERFDRKTRYLFLTHAHIDHFFAMGAFKDVEVVAAESAKGLFEHNLSIEWNEKAIVGYTNIFPTFRKAAKTAKPFMPTTWVAQGETFGSSDSSIVFANTGGHTTGSSYVFFPAEGVLIAGDLVQVDKYPYFGDRSTDLQVWIDTLKAWHAMELSKVCPGHGPVADPDYLRLEWEYFEALIKAVGQLKDDGVPVEEAVVHPSLPAGYWDPELPEPGWWKYCIALCYRSL